MTSGPADTRRRRVTIKDVAAAAGVSPMTVSNVINGRHKFVSESTRKTVEKEILRLNYRVQESARGLRMAQSRAVGVIIVDETRSFLSDHFNAHVVAGLSNVLSNREHALTLQGIPLEQFSKSFAVRNFSVDGFCVILSGPEQKRQQIIEDLIRMDQPVVLLQEPARINGDICTIRQDDYRGGQMLADHFAARRFKRILIVRPKTDWPAVEARIASFSAEIKRLSPEASVDIIDSPSEDFDTAQKALTEYLDHNPLPEAIFGANDRLAIGAMYLLQSRGVSIPGEVAIAGFNGFESRRYARPLITTVISPAYAIGETAGQQLLDRFSNGYFSEAEIVLPVYLETGETT
ncbi:LacI family DNA-binding transcriptional regulator [Brucella pituitosa]|uniref:LacI family DNA-binding transcriptional regulator n=1 Tax=Brucella pituitosa TaxID=571256 RepID=A0ABS3K347_9HYPH|nr:LacI family DNA-binding transcriptional regulator [Brucella pituitosa]MBO1041332.1 LacI family DNA-binding transcriptional regulator [Brucella pituitosa]